MRLIEVTLLINNFLWCAASIFLIYAAGYSILTLTIQTFLTALILFVIATLAELVIALLNH